MKSRDLGRLGAAGIAILVSACGTASDAPPPADASADAASVDAAVSPIADARDDTTAALEASVDTGADAPPIVASACATSPCINVLNRCPFPIWIHAAGNAGVVLTPDDARLGAAGSADSVRQYGVPASWPAARVNAYWVDPKGAAPDPTAFDKVEMTIGAGVMNYNITYVDYLALPSQMEAVGPSCAKTATFDPRVACAVPVANVLQNCPAGLAAGKRCLSAGIYCSAAANQASAFCHALDGAIATCAQQNAATCGIAAQLGNSTPNAYSCSGYFDGQPPNCSPASATCHEDGNKWCAALNRGMLASPDGTDTTQYYMNAPYNAYAKWVHETCPGIYAFAYDDYPPGAGESGFRSCTADRLDITFCPGG